MIMNKNKFLENVYEFASILVMSLIAICIIFTFCFKISTVVGQSMENTLHNGDTVIINAIENDVEYGDVVVISQPNLYSKVLIKRVIAVGGQTVEFDIYSSKLFIDGKEIDEPYIKETMKLYYTMQKSYTVPEGKVFVLGDNRNASADSRDPNVGFVDERYILGRVLYRVGDNELFNSDLKEIDNG